MLLLSSGNMEIDLTLGHSFLCTRMSFIADVWSKTAGCVSMPGCEEKLALFVLQELTLSGTGLWEVVSSSRHNVITCGVSFMAWLGDKQVIGRRSGVGKIRAACPFMSVSGRDEREDWTQDLVFRKNCLSIPQLVCR